MQDQSILSNMMLEWEAARSKGEAASPEDFCRDHPELLEPMRRRIAILEAKPVPNAGAETAAEAPKADTISTDQPDVPGYEILGVLGRGGMGVVYKARHLTLKRVVALKMIRSAAQAGAQEIARFNTEGEAVARLQHPNIVQIHDVGTHNGAPYFALEYVAGGSLDRRTAGRLLPPRRTAELVETLARAIHYAHERGIVHRDLKPGNVLVEAAEQPNDDFVPQTVKVTDFGLAKFYADKESQQTATGDVLGSPSYMAPEQASGKIKEIGPATDVYALGAILYELLTGRAPFQSATIWDTIAQVIQQDPVPPSQIQLKTPPDLETICLRCLEKSPAKRYASALALADDLRRFLDDVPILARPVGRLERIGKWARRRPALAALIVVSVLGVASLLTLGVRYSLDLQHANREIAKERDAAQIAEADAKTQRDVAQAAEAKTKEQFEKSRRSLFDLQLAFVKMVHDKDPGRGLALLDDAGSCPPDLRDFSWGLFRNICKRDRIVQTHDKEARAVAFLKNGAFLASTDAAGRLKIARLKETPDDPIANGDFVLPGGELPALRIAASSKGDALAAISNDGTVRLWDLVQGHEPRTYKDRPAATLAISSDGLTTATAGNGVVKHRIGREGRPAGQDDGAMGMVGSVAALALSPDGKRLVMACETGLRTWWEHDPETDPNPKGMFTSVAFFPDGDRFAACDHEGVVQWWDFQTKKRLGRYVVPRSILLTLAISPDGNSIAVAGMDGAIRVIDVATSAEQVILKGHVGLVWSIAFSPDGKTLASAGQDRTVRTWDLTPRLEAATLDRKSAIRAAAFSADGSMLATGGNDGNITLWDRATGKRLKTFPGNQGAIVSLAFSPKEPILASGGNKGAVHLWSIGADQPPKILAGHSGLVLSLAFSPDGRKIASAGQKHCVCLWNVQDGGLIWSQQIDSDPWSISFSPAGDAIAVGTGNGEVLLYDTAGKTEYVLPKRIGGVFTVAFSPDGKTLAAGGTDRAIELWDWHQRTQKLVLTGPKHSIHAVAFPPDGRTLASIADDGRVRLWDLVTGQERISLPMPTETGSGVAFASDGRTLAAFGQSKVVLWDTAERK